ncbi:MAG: tetratricopeptide repeat protein [Myxococcales bacterium]|jgi:hypothetical protein|nr:tetratricopeptide repeat protein [Myxococcales bacterium]
MRFHTAATFVVIATFIATAATAQDNPTDDDNRDAAVAKFQEAIAHFDAQDYAAALQSFHDANTLNPSWKLLYNIAHCDAALKNYGLALYNFEKYLAAGGDEISEDRRDEVLEELDRLRKIVGDLEIDAPEGLSVWVEHHNWGETPLPGPIPVPAGTVLNIELKQNGEVVFSTKRTVRGGATAQVVYSDPAQVKHPAESDTPAPVLASQQRKKITPIPFIVTASLTVALGATTIGMAAAVDAQRDDVKDKSDKKRLETMQGVGIGALAGTIAMGVTAGVLAFFTDFKGANKTKDKQPAPVSLHMTGAPQEAGLLLKGTF